LGTGLAAAARIDHREQHRSPTRNTPQARALRGTDAKEFPVLLPARIPGSGKLSVLDDAPGSYAMLRIGPKK